MNDSTNSASPVIGLLAWEANTEQSLVQLEKLPGNILHPATFSFTFRLARITGANYRTVVEQPNREVLARMIAAAKELEAGGVRAITTTCGFNAIFQGELADAVSIPVFTSSLIQVPLVSSMLGKGQRIGIITADRKSLTHGHLVNAGILDSTPVGIAGMEDTREFSKARTDPTAEVDTTAFIREVVEVAETLAKKHRDLGAIVLECTDLPPAAAAIRESLGLPVFDIVTLVNMVHAAVAGPGWSPLLSR